MLEKIKSYYTGKCGRGDYFGVLLFYCVALYGLIYIITEYDLSPLIIIAAAPVLYFFMLGAIIQRANSFTSTPWFFGVAFILWELASAINKAAEMNNYNYYLIDDFVFYAGIFWFVMNLILLFRPAKTEN
jgi:hypothetical protein